MVATLSSMLCTLCTVWLQLKHVRATLDGLRKSYSELESKAEGYLATMRKDKDEHTQMEELLRGEIAQHVSTMDRKSA